MSSDSKTSEYPHIIIRAREPKQFAATLREILNGCSRCDSEGAATPFDSECSRMEKDKMTGETTSVAAINVNYVKRNMAPSAEFLIYFEKDGVARRTGPPMRVYTGFLLGKLIDRRVFYIDLVCSKHRKGAALIQAAETLAKGLACHYIGLRAAYPKLRRYYCRNGFVEMANPCEGSLGRKTRGEREALRSLNLHATRTGHTSDGSGDGWWMAKCLTGPSSTSEKSCDEIYRK